MKKPWFIRMFGWFFMVWFTLGCLAWVGVILKIQVLAALGVMSWLGISLGMTSGMIWMVGSLVTWAVHQHAKQTFQGLASSGLGALQPGGFVAPPAAPSVLDNVTLRPTCQNCARAGIELHCCRHETSLCLACVRSHDSSECVYIPASRFVADSFESTVRRHTVAQSPLGLGSIK